MAKLLTAAWFALLAGCTTIDAHKAPPPDWPKLKVTIKKVGFWEMQTICSGSAWMFFLQQVMACAAVNLERKTCEIYYAADDEHGLMAVEHEREHCNGRDHHGSTQARDLWNNWKNRN